MPVEGVIFHVTDTLITPTGKPAPGVRESLERLKSLGVQIIAVSNNPATHRLQQAGIVVDYQIDRLDTNKARGSDVWMNIIRRETGLRNNQLLYVGNDKYDMITASRGPVVFVHAEWAAKRENYGIPAPSPQWVAAIVEHIFRKQHRWYWTLDTEDGMNRRVRKMALIDGNGAGDDQLKWELINLLKRGNPSRVGQFSLLMFVMLHLIASMYEEGLTDEAGLWTTYPSHSGERNHIMGNFLDVGAKLFRRNYRAELFVRHAPALKSKEAFDQGGIASAFGNQLRSVHLSPSCTQELKGKSVLVVDNFLTRGATTEIARNLLLAGGASEVVTVAVGKYGQRTHILTPCDPNNWDPFMPLPRSPFYYEEREGLGEINATALEEFVESHRKLSVENW